MTTQEQLLETIKTGYSFKGENVKLGVAMLDGNLVDGADVFLPLKTMNRHGLIAGATGTGAPIKGRPPAKNRHERHAGK